MQYALLIYEDETIAPQSDSPEMMQLMDAYSRFTSEITEEGVNKGGEALHGIHSATTVRIRDGQVAVTDGPFAETKEQLGGFYLIEAQDLDAAIAVAARIPGAQTGSIEVRPVVEWT